VANLKRAVQPMPGGVPLLLGEQHGGMAELAAKVASLRGTSIPAVRR
jgi:hypothetical protein